MPWFEETQVIGDPLPIQTVTLRQGDRLSGFAVQIEDDFGQVLDLTDARAYLTLLPLSATMTDPDPMFDRVELTIELPTTSGIVSYDWQASETMSARPGVYEVRISIEYGTGNVIVVPSSDQAAVIKLRSSIASDYFLVDETGALIPDGSGGFEIFDPLTTEAGTFLLLEDGSYLLLDP